MCLSFPTSPSRSPFRQVWRWPLGVRSWCLSLSAPLPTPPVPEPSPPCAKGQFACDQGKRCLGLELVCNFQAECDDGADEQQCGKGPGEQEPRGRDATVSPELAWCLL